MKILLGYIIYIQVYKPRINVFDFFRIAKALKESENYSQGIANNGNTSRNRKTVVRMQSK